MHEEAVHGGREEMGYRGSGGGGESIGRECRDYGDGKEYRDCDVGNASDTRLNPICGAERGGGDALWFAVIRVCWCGRNYIVVVQPTPAAPLPRVSPLPLSSPPLPTRPLLGMGEGGREVCRWYKAAIESRGI